MCCFWDVLIRSERNSFELIEWTLPKFNSVSNLQFTSGTDVPTLDYSMLHLFVLCPHRAGPQSLLFFLWMCPGCDGEAGYSFVELQLSILPNLFMNECRRWRRCTCRECAA